MLVSLPAFAAHMVSDELNETVDRVPTLRQEQAQPVAVEPNAVDHEQPGPGGRHSNSVTTPSRPYTGHKDEILEIGKVRDDKAVADSIGDTPDSANADSAPLPVESSTTNARIPGLSEDTLARFKKRMYRQDI